jgi:uncharacterized protein (DUF1015 family)
MLCVSFHIEPAAICPATIFPFPTMAEIRPFQAWRYDTERVPINKVVTQPYDKITPAMQESYYAGSPYNLVRIILGKQLGTDTASENVYTRAAAAFRDWRRAAVLRQDPEPSLYRYSQTFKVPGSEIVAERSGFIGLGRIEEYSAGVVFRHEQTHAKPKADRLDLLRATRAHFGQIFMLYSAAGAVDRLLESACFKAGSPAIEAHDEDDVIHRVWRISDPAVTSPVEMQMRNRNLIIADGHHRYETALAYRNQCRQSGAGGDAGEWMMMTFVDMDRPGLVILPTHRVISGVPSATLEHFPSEARQFFNVEELDARIDAPRALGILRQAGRSGIVLLAVGRERGFLLHTPKAIGTAYFGKLSLRQQTLDVVQLHKCLLESCLRISEEAVRHQEGVSYFRDAGEALAEVREGKAQMAFLMNPVRMEQVRDIALAGEVLPQKSTDFYPKLLSGLTIYALE